MTNTPSKEDLENKYIHKKMTIRELAFYYGVGNLFITNLLKQYKIPRRSKGFKFRRKEEEYGK